MISCPPSLTTACKPFSMYTHHAQRLGRYPFQLPARIPFSGSQAAEARHVTFHFNPSATVAAAFKLCFTWQNSPVSFLLFSLWIFMFIIQTIIIILIVLRFFSYNTIAGIIEAATFHILISHSGLQWNSHAWIGTKTSKQTNICSRLPLNSRLNPLQYSTAVWSEPCRACCRPSERVNKAIQYYCPFTLSWLSKCVSSLIWNEYWVWLFCLIFGKITDELDMYVAFGKVNFSWNKTFRDCCSDLCQKETCHCSPAASSKLNVPPASACLTTIPTLNQKKRKELAPVANAVWLPVLNLDSKVSHLDICVCENLSWFSKYIHFPSLLSCLNSCCSSDIKQREQQFISQHSQCRLFKQCCPLRKPSTWWESEGKIALQPIILAVMVGLE